MAPGVFRYNTFGGEGLHDSVNQKRKKKKERKKRSGMFNVRKRREVEERNAFESLSLKTIWLRLRIKLQ